MAIELHYLYKGIDASYWKILSYRTDCMLNKTIVSLGLYKDAITRATDVNNFLKIDEVVVDGKDLSLADIYNKIIALNGWEAGKAV